jgi:SOS response regulatory protein OraA/RecX
MAIFPSMVESLAEIQERAAYALAVKRLSRWERSATEIGRYLAERGFGAACIAATLERLHAEHAIDDARAAESHVAARRRSAGKGQRLVQRELMARGIAVPIAEAATAELDDDAAALELAVTRGRRREWLDEQAFASSVGPFLQRRGFDYETARRALRASWQQLRDAGGRDRSL